MATFDASSESGEPYASRAATRRPYAPTLDQNRPTRYNPRVARPVSVRKPLQALRRTQTAARGQSQAQCQSQRRSQGASATGPTPVAATQQAAPARRQKARTSLLVRHLLSNIRGPATPREPIPFLCLDFGMTVAATHLHAIQGQRYAHCSKNVQPYIRSYLLKLGICSRRAQHDL